MTFTKLQRIVVRNSLKVARQLRVKNETLYMQEIPKKDDFQTHELCSSTANSRSVLESVYPPELHELLDSLPCRELDGEKLSKFICSAARLERFIGTSVKENIANDDFSLETYRRLCTQVSVENPAHPRYFCYQSLIPSNTSSPLFYQRKLMKSTSSCITEKIKVVATAAFNDESSESLSGVFLYYYRIHIENTSLDTVQLVGRHWKITSGVDQEDVQIIPAFSHGVIGLTPTINPGETFYYTSCSALKNKEGSMEGSFLMMNLTTNKAVTVIVAPFKLIPL